VACLISRSCPPGDCLFAEALGHGEGASAEFACWDDVLAAVDALCSEFFRTLEAPPQESAATSAADGDAAGLSARWGGGVVDASIGQARSGVSHLGSEQVAADAGAWRSCKLGANDAHLEGSSHGAEGGEVRVSGGEKGGSGLVGGGGRERHEVGEGLDARAAEDAGGAHRGCEESSSRATLSTMPGPLVEEESVDEEEMRIIEQALLSAASVRRLATSQAHTYTHAHTCTHAHAHTHTCTRTHISARARARNTHTHLSLPELARALPGLAWARPACV